MRSLVDGYPDALVLRPSLACHQRATEPASSGYLTRGTFLAFCCGQLKHSSSNCWKHSRSLHTVPCPTLINSTIRRPPTPATWCLDDRDAARSRSSFLATDGPSSLHGAYPEFPDLLAMLSRLRLHCPTTQVSRSTKRNWMTSLAGPHDGPPTPHPQVGTPTWSNGRRLLI
ncbi:hypothetical protein FA13DRAFT_370286 [Coprinellus micaceus]|uniref:Uncharacterized protein n=1 Tax=Coprinellus micaceus TaxID=71717 RepID=A0A4Y7SCL7_COPMI|nr:hypothetical protein FA13DRAFT_370286 [Coprinellus micaceus]